MKTFIYHSLAIMGRGIGQVMFQGNSWSGWLMWIGICLNSWQLGLLALCGNLISTATAYGCGYSREAIRDGLYGFNGTLVGLAIGVFFKLSLGALALLAIGSALSTWIARLLARQRKLPGLTAPFILAVWLLLAAASRLFPDELLGASGAQAGGLASLPILPALALGIGQVMFQANPWSGLFFLVAILIQSRTAAFYTLVGGLLSIPIALLLGADSSSIQLGLMGYNGVLCAIALGDKHARSLAWACGSVALSVVLQQIGMRYGITTLTAPFVLSVWIVKLLQR